MGQSSDGVSEFLERFAKTWEQNDGRALGETFVDDGTLINPFGQRADGRQAVTAMYTEYFTGMLAGTSSSMRVESVRPVGEDHAFADAEQTITAADGSTLLVAHLTALLRSENGEWRFVDSRPYVVAAPPA